MRINIICVGKIKDKNLSNIIDEFIKRLSNYCQISIKEVEDESLNDNKANINLINKVKEIEGIKLLKLLPEKAYVIILDLVKNQPTSIEFADFLKKTIDKFSNNIYFVIGGSYGLSDTIKRRADKAIGLSNLTFTHQFTRLILLEQIYRSFKINNNEVYHKWKWFIGQI